jgi:gliding motility associated protien GldN
MTVNAIKTLRNFVLVLLMQPCIEVIMPERLNAQVAQYPYVKENTRTRRATPYVHERETDVMWSKRVWRTLDLREKFNHPLYYPEQKLNDRKSLFDIIKDGLMSGAIHAFDNPVMDDEFQVQLNKVQITEMFNAVDSISVENPLEPGTFINVAVPRTIESYTVKQYWMKEDWFFDKQRSVMDVRIVGMCPLQEKTDPTTGEIVGYKPLFWVYFPECRQLFANSEVFNTKNDAQRCSADDVFMKRMFSSFVHKESNVYDRHVVSYASGLDAQLESERIRSDIQLIEHDVWHF